MINVFIDVLIYNYTTNKSFFFLTSLNYRSIIYNIAVGLFVDYFIIHLYFPTTIFMILIFIIRHKLKINFYNILNYYIFNIGVVFLYYMLLSILEYPKFNMIPNIFFINSILILISYKKYLASINLYG